MDKIFTAETRRTRSFWKDLNFFVNDTNPEIHEKTSLSEFIRVHLWLTYCFFLKSYGVFNFQSDGPSFSFD